MNACQVTCLQLPVALVSICLISSCPTGKCLIELLSNLPCDEQLSNCQLPNCQSRNGPTGNYSSSSCSAAAFQLLLYASCPEQCSCQGNIVTMSSCKIVCMECSCLKGIQNNLLLLMVTFPFCMQHLVGRVVLRSVPLWCQPPASLYSVSPLWIQVTGAFSLNFWGQKRPGCSCKSLIVWSWRGDLADWLPCCMLDWG